MDRSKRILIDKIGIAFSLLLMAVAVLGEALGWWGDLGILLGLASLAVGVLSVLDVNGVEIVDEVRRSAGRLRADHGAIVENQETMIDNQEGIGATLDRIEQLLDARLPEDG